jgi:hypothetical protein
MIRAGRDWLSRLFSQWETRLSAIGMKITNFHYAETTFMQPKEFVEYPKWIHMSGYPSEIVQDAEGEAALLDRPAKSGDVTVALVGAKAEAVAQPIVEPIKNPILTGWNNEREILLKIAKEKNIKVDARWKTDRIRETVDKAGS